VLGVEATVEDVDLTDYGAIVAYCRRGKYRQAIGWTCRCRSRRRRVASCSACLEYP
jgi:hypothetical protein